MNNSDKNTGQTLAGALMIRIIKRGGFREQAARQLKYKDSVNQRSNIAKQSTHSAQDQKPANLPSKEIEHQNENSVEIDLEHLELLKNT